MEKPHKKLDVWQLGMDLAVGIYETTDSFPKEEIYVKGDRLVFLLHLERVGDRRKGVPATLASLGKAPRLLSSEPKDNFPN